MNEISAIGQITHIRTEMWQGNNFNIVAKLVWVPKITEAVYGNVYTFSLLQVFWNFLGGCLS
jgi:hypothetical protein